MIRDVLKCPVCASALPVPGTPVARPFPCPSCGQFLKVTESYSSWLYGLSIVGAFLLFYFFGVRSWLLLLATAFGWLPLYIVGRVFLTILVYPSVELSQPETDDLSFHLKDPPRGPTSG